MSNLVWVLPGDLRLPSSRRSGPDAFKLAAQVSQFGGSVIGMPLLQVTRAGDGLMMINEGVTRAVRVHRYSLSGTLVQAEVIEERARWKLSDLPKVSEV